MFGDLNTELVQYSNGQKKRLDANCHLNTGQPKYLFTRQMDSIFFSYLLVRYLNSRSSTKDIAQKPTILILNHLKSELQKVGVQMFPVFKCSVFRSSLYSGKLNTGLVHSNLLFGWESILVMI